MGATISAKCVKASVKVATCHAIFFIVRSWFPRLTAIVQGPLGGSAKLTDYVAVASSLSPPK